MSRACTNCTNYEEREYDSDFDELRKTIAMLLQNFCKGRRCKSCALHIPGDHCKSVRITDLLNAREKGK